MALITLIKSMIKGRLKREILRGKRLQVIEKKNLKK
jgi:hypothetical protein